MAKIHSPLRLYSEFNLLAMARLQTLAGGI